MGEPNWTSRTLFHGDNLIVMSGMNDASVDLVYLDPPFDSRRDHQGDYLSEAADAHFQDRVWVLSTQDKDFGVYQRVFEQARDRLKPGGVMVLHLGQSKKCDMAKELSRIAEPWFRVVDIFVEDVTHCESHGYRDKGTVKGHQYLVLQ